jgi:hypothetical protein
MVNPDPTRWLTTTFPTMATWSSIPITLDLTPRGATYNAGPQGGTQTLLNTQEFTDLTLQLLDFDGSTLIEMANNNGAGLGESIQYALESGTYYAQVSGIDNDVQLYGLSLSGFNMADINGDGSVNAVDAGIMFANWSGDPGPTIRAIPEPSSMALVLLAFCYQRTARHRQWGSVV